MDISRQLIPLYRDATLGNRDAFAFLLAWHGHCHAIDDHVDDLAPDRLEIVDRQMEANVLYSSPFYVAHAHVLSTVTALIADAYRTSVVAERAAGDQAALGDVLRLSGNQMVLAVAFLLGGWQHMQNISRRLWPLVWVSQHSED